MEPKFRMYESFTDLKKDVNNIKAEWKELKTQNNFNFQEYTDKVIISLENLVNDEKMDETIRFSKAIDLISTIDNLHFKGKINLHEVLSFCERSERLSNFIQYQSLLNDKDYWWYLGEAYINQDYFSIPSEIVGALFKSDRSQRENLMDVEETKYFELLPNEITVYRAMSMEEKTSENYRFSWTLSEEIAKKFLQRNKAMYGKNGEIQTLQINKNDAVGYINRRDEEEIIYFMN